MKSDFYTCTLDHAGPSPCGAPLLAIEIPELDHADQS